MVDGDDPAATADVDPDASPEDASPEYGDFPLKRFLGMELTGDEPGAGLAHVDVGPDHLNPNGVVHGAVLFALVDTAMGKATMSVIDDPGCYCASVEVSLRFIRAAAAGRLVATATVVKRGRHLAHLEARVVGEDQRPVATATGTFAILGP
jgi:uncharacterized protein (TIGR00369 family)